MTATRTEVVDRMLARCVDSNGCWEFTGARTPKGYGVVSARPFGKRQMYVHRVAYRHFTGPIPEGFVIDHLCRNRACCNPAHLEAVTQQVNILRGESLSAKRSAQEACHKGHPFDAENTRTTARGSRICRTCHRMTMRALRSARRTEGAAA